MALHIKDPEAERLARELAQRTGDTMTGVIVDALRHRVACEQRKARQADDVFRDIMEIADHCASLPVLDHRTLEEMLYDEHGLPA
jgi:antitoxin VapB